MASLDAALLPAAVILAVCSSGCSDPDRLQARPKVPAGGVLVAGAGATLPSPLYQSWFEAYRTDHPATVVTYDAVGSGEGIRRFLRKNVKEEETVDFGASDAAMRDEEIAQVSKGVVLVPMTAGAVVLAYNLPDFQGDLRLSRKAYEGIFLGEIKNWNDPLIAKANGGARLPKLTLTTVVRQDSSGTTYAFTKHLDAISEKWRSEHGPATLVNWPGNAMRAKGNEGVAARIKQSIGSIGYVSSEFARKVGLKVAILENKAGRFVEPTEQSCKAALATAELPENLRAFVPDPAGPDAYPIVTFSWVLLYKDYPDARKARAVRDLMRWCLSNGRQEAVKLGYVDLPPAVTAKALSAVETVGPAE
jgi:phosphate transport system substrate-binding protein